MADYNLILPFLDQNPTYAYGVELGLSILAPMLRKQKVIKDYFCTENEEQIRLAAHRLGYEVTKLTPWKLNGKDTGWVFMELRRRQ